MSSFHRYNFQHANKKVFIIFGMKRRQIFIVYSQYSCHVYIYSINAKYNNYTSNLCFSKVELNIYIRQKPLYILSPKFTNNKLG